MTLGTLLILFYGQQKRGEVGLSKKSYIKINAYVYYPLKAKSSNCLLKSKQLLLFAFARW